MMRGALFFLTDPDNAEAKMLRQNFVFKILPMLNPDGVINGNYRCSLAGCDLNRRWKSPSQVLHPTIYYAKRMISELHSRRGLSMFCDFHGHSRKQNVFMYGCDRKEDHRAFRILPYMLSKLNPYFSYESSHFGIQRSKEQTARISLYRALMEKVPCVYTLESSFAGVDKGDDKGMHLSTKMLESVGRDLCRTLLVYERIYAPQELTEAYGWEKYRNDRKKNAEDIAKRLAGDLEPENCNISEGSDSEPSEDNMDPSELINQLPEADSHMLARIRQREKEHKKVSPKKPNTKPHVVV